MFTSDRVRMGGWCGEKKERMEFATCHRRVVSGELKLSLGSGTSKVKCHRSWVRGWGKTSITTIPWTILEEASHSVSMIEFSTCMNGVGGCLEERKGKGEEEEKNNEKRR